MRLHLPIYSSRKLFTLGLLLTASMTLAQDESTESATDFRQDITPIFEELCINCHGPMNQRGGLRLDAKRHALAGGDSQLPILGGTLEDNELWRRVSIDDIADAMPRDGRKLTEEELLTIRHWIEDGTPWPVETDATAVVAEVPAQWWDPLYDSYQKFFDRFLADYTITLFVLLLGIALTERCRVSAKRDDAATERSLNSLAGAIARIPRSYYLIALMAIAMISIYRDSQAVLEHARIVAKESRKRAPSFSVETIYGWPPKPYRPDQPKRLGGEYYRGNCERNANLFNSGNYVTAILRLSLHDATGNKLKMGDDIPPSGMKFWFEIERAPGATKSLFNPKLMSNVFLTSEALDQAVDPEEESIKIIETVEQGERWGTFYPITDTHTLNNGKVEGLVYVCNGRLDKQGMLSGGIHYAVKYELVIEDGRIAEGSDMWVGNIYWNSSVALPQDPNSIPFEQWFSSNPMPFITGENSKDPKLLGVDQYFDADGNRR